MIKFTMANEKENNKTKRSKYTESNNDAIRINAKKPSYDTSISAWLGPGVVLGFNR